LAKVDARDKLQGTPMADEKLVPLNDPRAAFRGGAKRLETRDQKVQRLMIELAAVVDKRRTTRPENYTTVDAQVAATENELRKLGE
jgi:hypothetical protein